MSKLKELKFKRKKGLPPGSFVYTGVDVPDSYSELLAYDAHQLKKLPISELGNLMNLQLNLWLDMRGLEDVKVVENVGTTLGIHPLALEDILNTHQRAKLEEYPGGLFFVLHQIGWKRDDSSIYTEQIALHWNDKYLASFQELPDDTFKPICDRLADPTKKLRTSGPDYLAYAIIDYIVDSYFEVLDGFAERIGHVQERIIPQSNLDQIKTEISELRQELSRVKRVILPMREALSKLNRTDIQFIEASNQIYFRDIHDHIGQITDYLDNLSEDLNATHELYESEMSQRMNNVMKLLTMISTIFIPLSFIAGVYGMNFDVMPELRNPRGYYYTLGVMFLAAIGMLIYFRRKRWM